MTDRTHPGRMDGSPSPITSPAMQDIARSAGLAGKAAPWEGHEVRAVACTQSAHVALSRDRTQHTIDHRASHGTPKRRGQSDRCPQSCRTGIPLASRASGLWCSGGLSLLLKSADLVHCPFEMQAKAVLLKSALRIDPPLTHRLGSGKDDLSLSLSTVWATVTSFTNRLAIENSSQTGLSNRWFTFVCQRSPSGTSHRR
jgi:hypothetical protein